jgi:SAM-dependent methyltransferase
MDTSPWLRIPAADYEAHMAEIGQSAALRGIFARVYGASSPARVLVLGCTTGKDLALLDPEVTTTAVGIDLSARYLAIARAELAGVEVPLTLIAGDVLTVDLEGAEFDLVHAALLIEYVDPEALFGRMHGWLAPDGVCCTVSQNRAEGIAAVSDSGHASLLALDGQMSLRDPAQLNSAAVRAGLTRESCVAVGLPRGKSFTVAIYRKIADPERGIAGACIGSRTSGPPGTGIPSAGAA